MKLYLPLAALAALSLSFAFSSPTLAQSCPEDCGPTKGGGDGTSYEAGEPFNPFERQTVDDGTNGGPGSGPGNGPGTGPGSGPGDGPAIDPSQLPGYVAGLRNCSTKLGDLPKVGASAIRRVDDGVSVFAVCINRNLIDQQDGVESIRSAVQRNAAMKKALREAGGYTANDVAAVILDGEGARLYVHRGRDKLGSMGASSGGGAILQIY